MPNEALAGGKCTGSSNCRACKNCNYCKHCARDGGSCGVCTGGSTQRKSKKRIRQI